MGRSPRVPSRGRAESNHTRPQCSRCSMVGSLRPGLLRASESGARLGNHRWPDGFDLAPDALHAGLSADDVLGSHDVTALEKTGSLPSAQLLARPCTGRAPGILMVIQEEMEGPRVRSPATSCVALVAHRLAGPALHRLHNSYLRHRLARSIRSSSSRDPRTCNAPHALHALKDVHLTDL